MQGQWHLDIGYANYQLLLDSGIQKDHIDAPVMCTSCQVDTFNSFRKDPKSEFGVQLGVIAL
jgi:copper oxidase (laccase) domain-containing protein